MKGDQILKYRFSFIVIKEENSSNIFPITYEEAMHVAFACNVHSVTQLWLIWNSSIKTKSLNTKPCPAELYPRIICKTSPLLPKLTKLLHPPGMDCSPFPLTCMGNPGDGEKSYPTAKNLLISPIRKIPLNRFKSFAVKSFISSPSNSNFQAIILCNPHL